MICLGGNCLDTECKYVIRQCYIHFFFNGNQVHIVFVKISWHPFQCYIILDVRAVCSCKLEDYKIILPMTLRLQMI